MEKIYTGVQEKRHKKVRKLQLVAIILVSVTLHVFVQLFERNHGSGLGDGQDDTH